MRTRRLGDPGRTPEWHLDAARSAHPAGGTGRDRGETAVALAFDAVPANIRLARLVASCLMVERRFTVDDIEDVRIAVDEVCSLLVEHALALAGPAGVVEAGPARAPTPAVGAPPSGSAGSSGSCVELRFRAGPDTIWVEGRSGGPAGSVTSLRPGDGAAARALDPLTEVILDATVEDHRIEVDGPTLRVSFHKPLRGSPRAGHDLADRVDGEVLLLPVRHADDRSPRRRPEARL